MPYFDHSFDPASADPAGSHADISAREVEDAGLMEVLQTPGAAFGTWAILDALLDNTTGDFKFHEPLGKSREVKTALSGLFGRFVARAYATKYLNFKYFAHIHSPPMPLSFGSGQVNRLLSGDLPDWIAWDTNKNLAIIEAKGSHAWAGPSAVLGRAYAQAHRVDITIGGRSAPFKRFAIASRWGFIRAGPDRPMLWVKDPDVPGDGLPEELVERAAFGVARRHCASLLEPLGHKDLANAFLSLVQARSAEHFEAEQRAAIKILFDTPSREFSPSGAISPFDNLIGGFISRSGPIAVTDLSQADVETLRRLELRPTFVGIDRAILMDIINGKAQRLQQSRILQTLTGPRGSVARIPRTDGAGTWVYRLAEDEGQLAD